MANNVQVNADRKLQCLLKDNAACEFWALHFRSAMRVRCDDFFMQFICFQDPIVPQRFKDFDREEKNLFCRVMQDRYDEDGSADMTPNELDQFFEDMRTDPFIVEKIDLDVQKRKYQKHFSL